MNWARSEVGLEQAAKGYCALCLSAYNSTIQLRTCFPTPTRVLMHALMEHPAIVLAVLLTMGKQITNSVSNKEPDTPLAGGQVDSGNSRSALSKIMPNRVQTTFIDAHSSLAKTPSSLGQRLVIRVQNSLNTQEAPLVIETHSPIDKQSIWFGRNENPNFCVTEDTISGLGLRCDPRSQDIFNSLSSGVDIHKSTHKRNVCPICGIPVPSHSKGISFPALYVQPKCYIR